MKDESIQKVYIIDKYNNIELQGNHTEHTENKDKCKYILDLFDYYCRLLFIIQILHLVNFFVFKSIYYF